MSCGRFREAVSARLDGESLGLSASMLDAHLASCPDCAGWAEAAARVTRLARLDIRPVPDLSEEITAKVALPTRRVLRRRHGLRLALLVVGLIQLGLSIPALSGHSIGMAMSAHGIHEVAAWNLAIATAFVAAASAPRRAAGLTPVLATFLVVLAAFSLRDYAAGAVTNDRLGTHMVALAGLILLLALDRAERALPPSRHSRHPGSRHAEVDRDNLRTVA